MGKPGKDNNNTTLPQHKHKIDKKAQHLDKKHKEAQRQLQAQGLLKKFNPKSQSLPNLQPFKNKILQNLKSKTKISETIQNAISKLQTEEQHHLEEILENAADDMPVPADLYQEDDGETDLKINIREGKKYFKEIKKVIETCDILVQILDARDPMACRCRAIEQKILGMPGDKKIILLLNKIDLVPIENAYAWQTYLRREYATVLFKANLQNQQSNLSSNVLFKKSFLENTQMAEEMIQSSKSVGPDHLLQLIKQMSKVEGTNRSVTVGLVGYPNVGKSSVINSLKRMKACQVSSVAGSTKCLQEVKLDKQVKLLDCPGVIFEMEDKTNLILKNTLKLDDDLEEIVDAILKKVEPAELKQLYEIEDYRSCEDFLAKVARSTGKLSRGAIPDLKGAAKLVVEDWNKGRIKYFTYPPKDTSIIETKESTVMDLEA